MVQVAKPALITLKRADQVIAMPALPVAQQITGWLPVESILISRGVVIEPIIGVRHVAGAAPHRITSIPGWPGGGEAAKLAQKRPVMLCLIAPQTLHLPTQFQNC